eukprot:gene2121-2315_t
MDLSTSRKSLLPPSPRQTPRKKPSSSVTTTPSFFKNGSSIFGILREYSSFHHYRSLFEDWKEEPEGRLEQWERFRLSSKKWLETSWLGISYTILNTFISVISSIEFIVCTYLRGSETIDTMSILELSFAIFFIFDWIVKLFLADRKINYCLSFFSLLDILIIVTTLMTLSHDQSAVVSLSSSVRDNVVYLIYACSNVRILRALQLEALFAYIEDNVTRYLAEIFLNVIVFILFFSALVQFLEKEISPFAFHNWTYYVWVTISTVGYGDIYPHTIPGRFVAMVMIGFAIISVPKVTNELVEKMNLQTVYMRAAYTPKGKNSKHIVICGDFSSVSLQQLFEELFHEDHENGDLCAVLLFPSPPAADTILLMCQPRYVAVSIYLQGSALIEGDLKRAQVEKAQACFILTDQFAVNADEEDAKSILLNLSIKKYLSGQQREDMLFCTQLIRPENRRHLSKSNTKVVEENDVIVCFNEIKMGVMARALVCPGANTLIMNLVTSFSERQQHCLEEDSQQRFSHGEWIREYEHGCGWEIYTTTLAESFEGVPFCDLSYELYNRVGVVLFALEITDLQDGSSKHSRLVLNPADFLIPSRTEFSIKAFVIAKNQASSDLSFGDDSNFTIFDFSHIRQIGRKFGNLIDGRGSLLRASYSQPTLGILHFGSNLSSRSGCDESSTNALLTSFSASGKHTMSKWDLLKRTTVQEYRVRSKNYEEILTQLRDNHFNKNHYISPEQAVLLEQVTVKHSVFDLVPHLRDHLIVLGKGLSNLFDFIRPLRAKHLTFRYIVIICPDAIPHHIWQRISIFEGLLVVQGSLLEESSLYRAGIFRAAQVVVMADGTKTRRSDIEASVIDCDAIFAFQMVKRMNQKAQILVEVVNQSNIVYIQDNSLEAEIPLNSDDCCDNPRFAFSFAAGNLFTTSFLDSLICQSYYSPLIVRVVNELISGIDQSEQAELAIEAANIMTNQLKVSDGENNAPHASSISGISSKAMDHISDIRAQYTSRVNSIKGSCLYQIAIPDNLGGNTYGALYQHLSVQGMIPLGLLRGTKEKGDSFQPSASESSFVFTNPPKDTILASCDRVFVLSIKPVGFDKPHGIQDGPVNIQQPYGKPVPFQNQRHLSSVPDRKGTRFSASSKVARRDGQEDLNLMLSNIASLMEQTKRFSSQSQAALSTRASNRRGQSRIYPSSSMTDVRENSNNAAVGEISPAPVAVIHSSTSTNPSLISVANALKRK